LTEFNAIGHKAIVVGRTLLVDNLVNGALFRLNTRVKRLEKVLVIELIDDTLFMLLLLLLLLMLLLLLVVGDGQQITMLDAYESVSHTAGKVTIERLGQV
jgi:hypothetical protein